MSHRVYMSFFLRRGWQLGFLEADLRTSIGRGLTFADADKIRELIERTSTQLSTEDNQALDYALNVGRGGLYLQLTPEQYRKLKR